MGAAVKAIGQLFSGVTAPLQAVGSAIADKKADATVATDASEEAKKKEDLNNRRKGFLGLINTSPTGIGGALNPMGLKGGGLRGF